MATDPRRMTPKQGGIIHTYQKYDPINIPPPRPPDVDVISPAMSYFLMFGDLRELTEEELARAVRIDPSQIAGLGPSLHALMELLRKRKEKILQTYETESVQRKAAKRYFDQAQKMQPPDRFRKWFRRAVLEEQLYDMERIWRRLPDEHSRFAIELVKLIDILGEKYQIDELASKYEFTGHKSMTIAQALEIKEELETIDRLLKQLEEAAKTARLGVIDLNELSRFALPEQIQELQQFAQQLQEYLRRLAESQGLERTARGYRLTPKAYRIFQGKLLERIFSELQAGRSGRHRGPIQGEGAIELPQTRAYQFGDSLANMDVVTSMLNALVRTGPGLPIRIEAEDIEIHCTRNTPKCATVVILDMSGSMRYDGLYINAKRMALALDGLIRREFPGDYLQFLEMATFARLCHPSEIISLLPKFPTISDPIVRFRVDMSDERITEHDVPPHFTNIQHSLKLARQLLAVQDTPNRQIILLTDGLPTAHFEGRYLYLLYPPDPASEEAAIREALYCRREGIVINIFLLPTWFQSREDIQFSYRLAEAASGRVIFVAGRDLDRYVVWDYLTRRREILG